MQEFRYEDQNEVLLRGASCVDIKLELYFKLDRRIANSRGKSTAFAGRAGIFSGAVNLTGRRLPQYRHDRGRGRAQGRSPLFPGPELMVDNCLFEVQL
jgi:hypothetical protein